MKKKKMLIIVTILLCAIAVDATIFIWHPWTMGLPLYGWEHDEEMTGIYMNDTFDGEMPIGYSYRVYVESGGCLSCSRQIRLYGRAVSPYAWWTLESEGYIDSEGNMYWN